MKKIFIVYANAGAGHKKAAEAVKDAFDRAGTGHDVRLINSLDYTNRFFKRAYPWGYVFLVDKAPSLWAFFFYLTDFNVFRFLIGPIRKLTNLINGFGFYRFIIREKPDCVISTHFLATEITANLKAIGLFKGRHITCITDYGVHSFWLAGGVDNYVVASESSRKELMARGVAADKISVLGIPIGYKFTGKLDKSAVLKKLGLRDGFFNVLIIGGGFGVGPIEELVNLISKNSSFFQLMVVCGNNQSLFGRLKVLTSGRKIPIKIYGFVENVHELMEAADVMISKPGGISLSEALVKGLPVLVPSYIAGQEEKNLRFLEKNKAGFEIKNVGEALQKLEMFYFSKDILYAMKEKARQLGMPSAADDIVLLALEAIKG